MYKTCLVKIKLSLDATLDARVKFRNKDIDMVQYMDFSSILYKILQTVQGCKTFYKKSQLNEF